MLGIRLLRLLVYITAVSLVARPTVLCIDVSEAEIENIGNDVKRNFDEEGFNNQQSPAKLALPSPLNAIANPLPLQTPSAYLNQHTPERKHRPTPNQIQYLIQNKNNPAPQVFRRARAVLTGQSVQGLINLKQIKGGPVLIFGTIQGFPRQGKFGFHFHEFPVQGDDCESAGEHFNPGQNSHGDKDSFVKHDGDLGNIVAQYNGIAHVVLTSDSVSLANGPGSVLGRSLVVHVNEDDLGTRPNRESAKTGNSGYRLSCGTVELLPPVLTANNRLN